MPTTRVCLEYVRLGSPKIGSVGVFESPFKAKCHKCEKDIPPYTVKIITEESTDWFCYVEQHYHIECLPKEKIINTLRKELSEKKAGSEKLNRVEAKLTKILEELQETK